MEKHPLEKMRILKQSAFDSLTKGSVGDALAATAAYLDCKIEWLQMQETDTAIQANKLRKIRDQSTTVTK